MNTTQTISWEAFKNELLVNSNLDLQFQYAENTWVDASYHITEIKQAPITSVDCGGVKNSWTEIIIQLWEPGNKQQERAMKVSKALSIIGIVEKVLPLNPNAVVKIEFGNSQFDTRQMFPGSIRINGENLIVDLQPDFTQCKAINRGESCGPANAGSAGSTPEVNLNTDVKRLSVISNCAPGSGCC